MRTTTYDEATPQVAGGMIGVTITDAINVTRESHPHRCLTPVHRATTVASETNSVRAEALAWLSDIAAG